MISAPPTPDYFYAPPEQIHGELVNIEGDEFAHLTHVMRKREGDIIRIVDGKGTAYDVRLILLKKHIAEGAILASYTSHNESTLHVALAVGLLKNPSRFDILVEKATELGVKEIVPLTTSRTISHHAKTERWQKLALAAMKQSCRSFLPEVKETMTIEEVVSGYQRASRKLLFHEKSSGVFHKNDREGSASGSSIILIGPEGGFSDEEVEYCMTQGYSSCSLGERRLRTETAAIVATSLVLL